MIAIRAISRAQGNVASSTTEWRFFWYIAWPPLSSLTWNLLRGRGPSHRHTSRLRLLVVLSYSNNVLRSRWRPSLRRRDCRTLLQYEATLRWPKKWRITCQCSKGKYLRRRRSLPSPCSPWLGCVLEPWINIASHTNSSNLVIHFFVLIV